MIIVDANAWIAAYVPDEPQHHQSRVWLFRAIKRGELFAAPRILLLEIGSPSLLVNRVLQSLNQALVT